MLKLNRIRTWQVPNALAVAAALLLVASSLAGVERPANPADAAVSLADGQANAASQPEAGLQPLAHASGKQTRKFRVNLFLFRH
jgi:hypothetical protein